MAGCPPRRAVQGDVLKPDDTGQMVPSPSGQYGLMVYDEPYRITGLQVSRQAGASAMVVGQKRTAEGQPNAANIILLRGFLESQYLSGRLALDDIYARFGPGSTATEQQTWRLAGLRLIESRLTTRLRSWIRCSIRSM